MPKMNFEFFLMSVFVFECLLVRDQLPKRKFFFVLVFSVWCLLVSLVFFVQIVLKLYFWNEVTNFCFCLPKKTAYSLVQTVQVILSNAHKLHSDTPMGSLTGIKSCFWNPEMYVGTLSATHRLARVVLLCIQSVLRLKCYVRMK